MTEYDWKVSVHLRGIGCLDLTVTEDQKNKLMAAVDVVEPFKIVSFVPQDGATYKFRCGDVMCVRAIHI